MATVASPTAEIPQAPVKGTERRRVVPFRIASLERVETLPSETGSITAAQQSIDRVIEGTGFLYGVTLDMVATVDDNVDADVAYAEDAPWSSLASVILRDPSGEIVNLTGFQLFLFNLAMKQYAVRNMEASAELFSAVTGTGDTGGSFSFLARVPAGINRRTLLGILGNQDRSVKYQLRTDIAPSSAIYTVPTDGTAPTFALNKFYENYAVPPMVGPAGPQQIVPENFGTLAFATSTLSESSPLGGSTVNHYLRRIGNTIRFIILTFRVDGARAAAQADPPSRIALKFGDTDVFSESYRYRRYLMFERYGFDWPDGVLVYDAMHDFVPGAGNELGDDWYNTQHVNTAQFQITYPSAFGSSGNSLEFVTSDIALVGQPLGS